MEHEQELRKLLVRSSQEIGVTLTDNQVALFMCYLSQLTRWNETINLTSITRPQDIVVKHFVDSLTGIVKAVLSPHARLVDVGTGGGFPGIPIKIARDDLKLVLVEPNKKKCSFLLSVLGVLCFTDAEVFNGTVQEYCHESQGIMDVATVRAVKFEGIQDSILALLKEKGKVILYRTSTLAQTELGKNWNLVSQGLFSLPLQSGKRVISVLEKG
ncbi:MAG TPA: 16S rRNA (guanine(527)-N(7))-methyltransferase RsmG [Nitrospira sp.]|nr:16S rRNA (guanine(527)-N(7))-methyltransferase RsmG [Nitrospira sp.]